MTFTGRAASLPKHPALSQLDQETVIFRVATEIGVPARLLAAVRIAEAGGPGREFGVLSQPADTYEAQAQVCAVSLRNNLFRFVNACDGAWPFNPKTGEVSRDFVDFMAARWAPRNVENDPSNLNRHWPDNVMAAYTNSGVI